MYKDERDIYYYDVVSKVWNRKIPAGLPQYPHHQLAQALEKMFAGKHAEHRQTSTKQSVYITQIEVHPDRCELLLGFTDPRAADPTLADRSNNTRRVINKVLDEGIEHSAHVIWRYGNPGNADSCAFFLEGATGLRSGVVVRFINRLLRIYNDLTGYFSVPDPTGALDADGNFKKIKVRPRIELLGHPSAEFIKDLKKGELTEIELYTESAKNTPWDGHGYAVEKSKSVLIVPNPAKHLPKAFGVIGGVLTDKNKANYEYARIKFKTESNIVRNVRMFSDDYKLVNDDSYVKRERIEDLGNNLPNAFAKFNTPILTKMRALAGI